MRKLIGLVGCVAAAVFVLYSAVTLYNTAYNLTSLEWQKPYAAGAAAAVVIFEAVALILVAALWKESQRFLAIGVFFLLVAASLWSLRLELVNQIHGQADTQAGRQGVITRSQTDATQLEALARQQKIWTTRVESASGRRQLSEFRAELDAVNAQIAAIINRLNSRPVIAEVSPDAALAARVLGGVELQWRDWFMLLSLAFWPLARILATPAAVQFWIIASQPPRQSGLRLVYSDANHGGRQDQENPTDPHDNSPKPKGKSRWLRWMPTTSDSAQRVNGTLPVLAPSPKHEEASPRGLAQTIAVQDLEPAPSKAYSSSPPAIVAAAAEPMNPNREYTIGQFMKVIGDTALSRGANVPHKSEVVRILKALRYQTRRGTVAENRVTMIRFVKTKSADHGGRQAHKRAA